MSRVAIALASVAALVGSVALYQGAADHLEDDLGLAEDRYPLGDLMRLRGAVEHDHWGVMIRLVGADEEFTDLLEETAAASPQQ